MSARPIAGAARLAPRWRSACHKLGWGLRTVGPGAALSGLARLAALKVRRPREACIRLRSGFSLEFDCASQLPTIPVVFGDLIDPEYAFLRVVARPDWIVVDVGASIGPFSLFAAGLPVAAVHAYEPSPPNLRMLRRNAARNGLASRIHVHPLALAEAEGEANFTTADQAWNSGLSGRPEQGGELVRVGTVAGEFRRLGLERAAVLKVNVAGFEPAVLEGAMPCLEAGRIDILILLLGLPSLPHYAAIAALGYRFFYYHPRRRVLHEVVAFDEASVLNHRPWPARHIIAIRAGAVHAIAGTDLPIRRL